MGCDDDEEEEGLAMGIVRTGGGEALTSRSMWTSAMGDVPVVMIGESSNSRRAAQQKPRGYPIEGFNVREMDGGELSAAISIKFFSKVASQESHLFLDGLTRRACLMLGNIQVRSGRTKELPRTEKIATSGNAKRNTKGCRKILVFQEFEVK